MKRMNFVNILLFPLSENLKRVFSYCYLFQLAPRYLNIHQYMKMKYEMKPLTLI